MRLDVGCGNFPSGDVNCDLFVRDVFNHRDNDFDVLSVKRDWNFVCCDGRFLPFKDGCFSEVFCAQLIEHMVDPFGFFCELVRVCCGRLVVETVHRVGEAFHLKPRSRRWFRVHHVSKFNMAWFRKAGEVCGLRWLRNYVLEWVFFPSDWFCFMRLPYVIGVVFEKGF